MMPSLGKFRPFPWSCDSEGVVRDANNCEVLVMSDVYDLSSKEYRSIVLAVLQACEAAADKPIPWNPLTEATHADQVESD